MCTLPPLSYLAGCGEAAAGSTVPELRWPPTLRTEPLSPGGRRQSPGPTARPSHRTGPLHGTSPSPGGPEQEEVGRARVWSWWWKKINLKTTSFLHHHVTGPGESLGSRWQTHMTINELTMQREERKTKRQPLDTCSALVVWTNMFLWGG